MRQRRRLTLTETAARAGISPQYLSEVERGRKDPSSEMISAIVGALRLDLALVLDLTARDVRNTISLAGAHPPVTPRRTAARTRLGGPVALARPVALAA
jgi:transcriptional regulator with XRE-family HTH domain